MGDGDSIVEHLNAFNTIVTQLISIGVNMDEESLYDLLVFFSKFMEQPDNGH
jgi:hypothetical protein